MTNDITGNTAAAYLALKRTLEDLCRLGSDFGEAVREAGYEFSTFEEYSKSPSALVLKKNHAWFFSEPIDETQPKSDGSLRSRPASSILKAIVASGKALPSVDQNCGSLLAESPLRRPRSGPQRLLKTKAVLPLLDAAQQEHILD